MDNDCEDVKDHGQNLNLTSLQQTAYYFCLLDAIPLFLAW